MTISKIRLPDTFPQSDYTPFGYLDNPAHSGVMNPSGILRTVPPLGFGWWARAMPWPYGMGVERPLSYLSFLHLSVAITSPPAPLSARREGESEATRVFHTADDFAGVNLVSNYHTKTLMSYDWSHNGLNFSAKYFLAHENALVCVLEIENTTSPPAPPRIQGGESRDESAHITIHATHIYGYPGHLYWGRDGVTSRGVNSNSNPSPPTPLPPGARGENAKSPRLEFDTAISKVWAYGDVFALGADRKSTAYKATSNVDEWNGWIRGNDLSSNDGALVRFHETQDPIYSVMSYPLDIPAGESVSLVLCLARGTNEPYTLRQFHESVKTAPAEAARQLAADEAFYANAPVLTGDWPEKWKHGWIYDFETIRMTIRPPLGIFKHHWDAMQIHTPRSVLGEMSLDALCLSYADIELAKEVIYGTFADAPVPNVPCVREDGSMNMIGESGAECGTAPTWGFPFLVIQSIYQRDGDDHWIRELYPHLKVFIEWWLAYRTDSEGWFHANNSWESGQDGSKRFLHGGAQEGTPADFVRTVDIEAGLAQGMLTMVDYAKIAGYERDVEMWRELAEDRINRTRSMYVDGWFRDWDGRENKPFMLDDYYDVMMLAPLAVGVATPEQIEGVRPKFQIFRDNPQHWLEWPSFWQPFSEAAWKAGLRTFVAEELVKVGERIYGRTDAREISGVSERYPDRLPAPYSYRIPGVSSEFWPVKLDGHPILNGCENYGWGATFPTLVIRNIVGFREIYGTGDVGAQYIAPQGDVNGFILAPALPETLFEAGKTVGITNLRWRDVRADVEYSPQAANKISIRLKLRLESPRSVTITDEAGNVVVGAGLRPAQTIDIAFEGENGGVYRVQVS